MSRKIRAMAWAGFALTAFASALFAQSAKGSGGIVDPSAPMSGFALFGIVLALFLNFATLITFVVNMRKARREAERDFNEKVTKLCEDFTRNYWPQAMKEHNESRVSHIEGVLEKYCTLDTLENAVNKIGWEIQAWKDSSGSMLLAIDKAVNEVKLIVDRRKEPRRDDNDRRDE